MIVLVSAVATVLGNLVVGLEAIVVGVVVEHGVDVLLRDSVHILGGTYFSEILQRSSRCEVADDA